MISYKIFWEAVLPKLCFMPYQELSRKKHCGHAGGNSVLEMGLHFGILLSFT